MNAPLSPETIAWFKRVEDALLTPLNAKNVKWFLCKKSYFVVGQIPMNYGAESVVIPVSLPAVTILDTALPAWADVGRAQLIHTAISLSVGKLPAGRKLRRLPREENL